VVRSPLRGRDQELALISERLSGALSGRGAVVAVEGRAGLGKTRLIAEAMAIAQDEGLSVGSGVVAASDQAVPMGPLVAAVLPLVDPATRSALPYLREQRYWLLEELEGALEKLAMRSPLLLCIDDVQWGDTAFLTALRTLPVRLMTFPIVWLFAYRSPQAPPQLRAVIESLEQIGVDRLPLRPLSDAAVAEIVTDVLGAEPGDALLEMVRRSHGSPFLLVELLHGWQEDGLVHVDSGVAELVEMRLPGRVREGMQDRLGGMSDLARRAALVASVLERRFSFDQVSMMLGEPVPALLGPVDELERAELLTEEAGLLVFRHDLIRDAVRDTLPASARRSLQRQAVDVLLATGAVPGDVAVQLAQSAEPGDAAAVQTLHEASRAVAASGPGTAADLSRRALDLAGKDDPLRGTLAAETALLLHAAGRAAEGKEFADRILGEVLPAEQEGQVRLSIARMLALSADVRADSGRRALALPRISPLLRGRHLATLAHNLVGAGRLEEARTQLGEARAVVERSGDANAIFTLGFAEAALQWYTSADLGRALEMTEAALRDRHQADEPQRVLVTEELRTEQLAALDRYDLSLRLTADGLMAAQRAHQEWGVRLWDRWRGRQLLQLGQLSDAAAALEGIADLGDDANPASNHDAAALVALGRLAIHRGDQSRRRRCAELGQSLIQNGPPLVRRHGAWLLALLSSADGNHEEARRQLGVPGDAERLQVLPRFPLDVTDEVELVRIATAVGDPDLAETAMRSASDRAGLNPGVFTIAGTFAHIQALIRDDRDAYAEAIENFAQGPRPLALASALEDCGRLCAGRGNADDAVEELGRALEIYARLGASWDAGRVRRRLRSLGVHRRLPATPAVRNGWAALTDSELAVVGLVVQGMTNREVAERLFVSPHTVSTHLRHVFEKLKLNSRMELAVVAARHGVPALAIARTCDRRPLTERPAAKGQRRRRARRSNARCSRDPVAPGTRRQGLRKPSPGD
jgi:DNA-binding CsgD family transcriptional regulator